MTTEFNWGAEAVDLRERSLPGLKASFLVQHAPRTGRVLEIGSGDGKMLRTLAAHSPALELFGCDVRPPRTPPDCYSFSMIEGERLPAKDRSFDAVLVMDVLEHVPDPAKLLDDTARVLKPGGKLIAFVPVEGEPLSAYRLFRTVLGDDVYVQTKEHVQAFTHVELRRLVEARFRVEEWRYAYHAVGHTLDASFFAAQKLGSLRDMWRRDNAYYNADKKDARGKTALLNALLRAGNLVAWAESSALAHVKTLSAGVLFCASLR